MEALGFVIACRLRDPVAQVVEQRPFKADVEGSSPSWVTLFPWFYILFNFEYIRSLDAIEYPVGIYIIQMSINGFNKTQKVIPVK